MPEILTDAYLLFTFVFKQALSLISNITHFSKILANLANQILNL